MVRVGLPGPLSRLVAPAASPSRALEQALVGRQHGSHLAALLLHALADDVFHVLQRGIGLAPAPLGSALATRSSASVQPFSATPMLAAAALRPWPGHGWKTRCPRMGVGDGQQQAIGEWARQAKQDRRSKRTGRGIPHGHPVRTARRQSSGCRVRSVIGRTDDSHLCTSAFPIESALHSRTGSRMDPILVGKAVTTPGAAAPSHCCRKYGNRHGLVAGATGTGKTVSLMVLAEGFSRIGVPVFMADVKGDVAGLAMPGTPHDKLQPRVARDRRRRLRAAEGKPAVFWDLYGKLGHPVRTTVSEIGPDPARRASSSSTTRSRACSTSRSSSPTTAACCCSTSTTCARCSASSPRSARRSRPSTASSARSRSARSSARC